MPLDQGHLSDIQSAIAIAVFSCELFSGRHRESMKVTSPQPLSLWARLTPTPNSESARRLTLIRRAHMILS